LSGFVGHLKFCFTEKGNLGELIMKSKMHPNSFFLFCLVIVLMLTSCTSTLSEVASTPIQAEPQIVEVTKIVAGTPVVQQIVVTPTPLPEAPKPEGEILVWGWVPGDQAFASIMEGFNKEYPDIKVDVQMIPGNNTGTRDALAAALAAGSGAPDVTMIEINDVGRFVMQGGLVDLKQPPFNLGKYEDDFVPYKWQQGLTLDGKLLAFPWDIGPAGLFYRRDIFEAAGLPSEPEEVAKLLSTWQGYLDTGEKVNDPDNNIFWTDNISNIPYIYFAHKNFFDEDLNIAFDNPRTLELFNYALEGRRANLDANIPAWTQEWYSALGSGQIATTIAGSWFGGFLKSFVDPEGSGKWGVVPIPEDPLQNWGGSFLAIPEQSKNKEAACAFVEYVTTNADAQNRIFINVDYFPAYMPAWDNPLYEEGDPYFAGQKTRQMWIDIATSEGKVIATPLDSAAETAFNAEIGKMLDQNLDPAATLQNAVKAVEDSIAKDKETLLSQMNK
jgi:multiple sugar transport system substrate-binding protein